MRSNAIPVHKRQIKTLDVVEGDRSWAALLVARVAHHIGLEDVGVVSVVVAKEFGGATVGTMAARFGHVPAVLRPQAVRNAANLLVKF